MTLLKVKGKWYVQVMRNGEIYTAGKGFDKKEDAQEAQALLKAKFKKAKTHTLLRTFYDLWLSQAYKARKLANHLEMIKEVIREGSDRLQICSLNPYYAF